MSPEDDGWGSNWQELELECHTTIGSIKDCLPLNPPQVQRLPLPRQPGISVRSSCFLVPLSVALSPGMIHQAGQWVVTLQALVQFMVTGWSVLTLRSPVLGAICSLMARGGTCLAFALMKC